MSHRHLITAALVKRLFERSQGARWRLSLEQFEAALDASVAHAFAGRDPTPDQVDRYLELLNIGDLALAAACAAGHEAAWDHFVREFRPALYRAADAIDPSGGVRDLADALHADLFGLKERDGERQSLFRYFHGRSSLPTWLRAVLSQRHVDRIRIDRRMDPLPEDDGPAVGTMQAVRGGSAAPDPERSRYLQAMRLALAAAIAALAPRDRLRLSCYYAQDMTLSTIGKMLGEHEGTVSRHLTRTRGIIRSTIDARLQRDGLDESARAECFRSVMADAGSIDLAEMVSSAEANSSAVTEPVRNGRPSISLGPGPSTALGPEPSTALRPEPSTALRPGKKVAEDRSR